MQEFKTAVETADTEKIESMLADNVVFRSPAVLKPSRTSSTSTRTGSSMIYA